MIYFNGFGLKDEEKLFKDYIIDSDSCISGFSYGAIKAFEEAYHRDKRVDRLILLSPALFQTQKISFIKTQLKYFRLDSDKYIQNFINNTKYPSSINLDKYISNPTIKELDYLLNYKWNIERLKELQNRGTKIEIFIGDKDKIVDNQSVIEFFESVATIYILKDRGHILQSKKDN